MRGSGIVILFTESRKVYEVVLNRAINFELIGTQERARTGGGAGGPRAFPLFEKQT